MRWWPWRRRKPVTNGDAIVAKHRAEDRLRKQRYRWVEVYEAKDAFAAAVERAMRGER